MIEDPHRKHPTPSLVNPAAHLIRLIDRIGNTVQAVRSAQAAVTAMAEVLETALEEMAHPTPTGAPWNLENLRELIAALAARASYGGLNLLTGEDISISFDTDGRDVLLVRSVRFDPRSLGLNVAATGPEADAARSGRFGMALAGLRILSGDLGGTLETIESRCTAIAPAINRLVLAGGFAPMQTGEDGVLLMTLRVRDLLAHTPLPLGSRVDRPQFRTV